MLRIPLKLLTASLLGIALHTSVSANGLHFFSGSWDEARTLARKQHKALFVTAYTNWCHTCTHAEIQADQEPALADYYNQHFVSYKIDIETQDGAAFAAEYGIKALPDCLFFDADGKIIQRSRGEKDKWALLDLGMQAADQLPQRSAASNKIDSQVTKSTAIAAQMQQVYSTAEKTMWQNVATAIANNDQLLLQRTEVAALQLPNGEEQQQRVLIAYYKGIGDLRMAARIERQQKMKAAQMKDPLFWQKKAGDLVRTSGKKKHLKQALQWIQHSISIEAKYDNQETYSYILYKLGKRKEARKAAETALVLAKIADKPCYGAYNLLQILR